MAKYLFYLSGENLKLAKEEVLSIVKSEKSILSKKLLLLKTKTKIKQKTLERLAYTKRVYDLLFSCSVDNLEENLGSFPWDKVYEKDFCLRVFDLNGGGKKFSEPKLAGYIWNKVKKPKVNLENAKTQIHLYIIGKKVFCGKLVFVNKENFEKRKPQHRPGFSPTSLHPKLARCLVNLSGVGNGVLVDPFCGTGGILIEAGLMDCDVVGYDISDVMLKKCKQNLDFFKIKKFKVIKKDFFNLKTRIKCLVTDLPYGMSSLTRNVDTKIKIKNLKNKGNIVNKKKLEEFYLKILKRIKKSAVKNAVVVFPAFVNYKKIIKKSKLKIKKEFDYFIHKNLSKKILVFN